MIKICFELAFICLLPDYVPPEPPKVLTDYPALMVMYDPVLCTDGTPGGEINCDDDPTTVATGPLTQDMYFVSGACHPDLLGATVHFPYIDFSMKCVDTGGAIIIRYNDWYQREVLYFDVLWDYYGEWPYWLHWLLDDWYFVYD